MINNLSLGLIILSYSILSIAVIVVLEILRKRRRDK